MYFNSRHLLYPRELSVSVSLLLRERHRALRRLGFLSRHFTLHYIRADIRLHIRSDSSKLSNLLTGNDTSVERPRCPSQSTDLGDEREHRTFHCFVDRDLARRVGDHGGECDQDSPERLTGEQCFRAFHISSPI